MPLVYRSKYRGGLTPSIFEISRRFGGTYRFIQSRRISKERNQQRPLSLPATSAGYFLGLTIEPEDGGDMFL
jgi:hypothetical protein